MNNSFARTIVSCVIVLAVGSNAVAQSRTGSGIEVPAMPADIEVQGDYSPFLVVHAIGTQNYMCLPATPGVAWTLVGPQATLFLTDGVGNRSQQLATHFLSANPSESGLPRPTWQHSLDTSRVWARLVKASSDPNFVEAGAIPWLLLTVTGAEPGPAGGSLLTPAAFIQRLNTSGGAAPAAGCAQRGDIGSLALVPYAADYFFYKPSVQ